MVKIICGVGSSHNGTHTSYHNCQTRAGLQAFFPHLTFYFIETEGRKARALEFHRVERRFHGRESNRQPLPLYLGTFPPSSGSLRSSRTRFYFSFEGGENIDSKNGSKRTMQENHDGLKQSANLVKKVP